MKENPVKFAEYLQKEKERDKARRENKKQLLKNSTLAVKKEQKLQRQKQNERQRKCREKKKSAPKNATPSTAVSVAESSSLGSYRRAQTLGKAIHRAKRSLPLSPRKRLAVVKKLPNIQSVHHVVPINVGTIDVALTKESAHNRIYLLPHSDKDISINNTSAVGDFVQVVLSSASKKTSKNYVGQIKQMDGDDIQIEYLKNISDNVYVWPNRPDVSWEKQNVIIKKLSPPEIINSRLEMKFI